MAMQEFGFGVGDDNIGSKGSRLKLKDNETVRVSFAWWPGVEDGKPNMDASTPRFLGVRRLYIQNVGYVVDKGPEYVKLAGAQSKQTVGTILVRWPLDPKGNVDRAAFQNGDFQVCSWVFSSDKYKNIGQIHSEFPLGKSDLKITCTDATYQKISMMPCTDSLLRKLLDAGKATDLFERVARAAASLSTDIAQDLTLDQIREKMSGKSGSPVIGGGRAAPVASNPEIDGMLDDILK